MALADVPDMALVATAHSTDALFGVLQHCACDLLLTDLHMPGGMLADGVPMLNLLRQGWPHLPVLVFTMQDNLALLQMVAAAGARGVMLKSEPLSRLPEAIRCVHRGGSYFSDALQDKWLASERQARRVPATPLSIREQEVFIEFVRGANISEIAQRLGRSVKTVSRQKRVAMAKLRLANDVEAFAYAHAQGLLD